MKYLVIYDKADDGMISARVHDLSGCYSCGNTILEAKKNVKVYQTQEISCHPFGKNW